MFNVESLERAELGESLLTWIQTFNVEAPCQTVEDLTSGVVMAQVLQKIDPAYFDENWLNRIKTEVGDNWRLKGRTDRMLPETKIKHTAAVYVLTWPGNLSAWFLLSDQLCEGWNAAECFVY